MNAIKQLKFFNFVLFIIFLTSVKVTGQQLHTKEHKLTSYVNPFIGTEDNKNVIHSIGNTHPGAVRPRVMVAVSPQSFDFTTKKMPTAFRSEEKKIYGFSCVNFSGVGCPIAGNIPSKFYTKPFDKEYQGSSFSEQVAIPGYYSVFLKD